MRIKRPLLVLATFVAVALAANIPNASLAQGTQASQATPGQPSQPVPELKGGLATVIGVDQPENCLRIRSGPGSSYDVIGCANLGEQLNITGVWTSNNWAQLAGEGWVYGPQIQSDLRPPATAYAPSGTYVAVPEVYYEEYPDTYLPDYGYSTYWYGGAPVLLYNINVWRKFHPWWWHKNRHHGHHQKAWKSGDSFRRGGMTSTQRNFVTNRSRSTSANIGGFDARRLRSGSTAANISGFNAGRLRSGSSAANISGFNAARFRSGSPNVIRSNRTFSSPNTIRMGNIGAGQMSRARMSGFSGGQSSGARFDAARVGGGGMHMGGGGGGRRR